MTVGCLVALVACGGGTQISGPSTETTQTAVAPAPVAAAPAAQPVAETPAGAPFVGTISGANFSIKNNSGNYAIFVARIYEVVNAGGEQQLRQEIKSGNVATGETWGGKFDALPCNYQIDLDLDFVVVNPPAPGEIAHKIVTGNVCPGPEPTPTPSPSPSPTPDSGVCHVSNKGKDGNWDLVIQWKQGETPGHLDHFDGKKFCPTDFKPSVGYTGKPVKPSYECKTEGTPEGRLLCSCDNPTLRWQFDHGCGDAD